MKEQILEINKRLEDSAIDYKQARKELCVLFSVNYCAKMKGRAIVKSKKQKWIYEGYELPITSLYMTHKNGVREFRLSLEGTPFVESHGYTETVIRETDLEILELYED